MKDYRKLVVWERAHRLVLCIYQETGTFPREEQYGLTSQIRRAAVSTPTNIAEGCGKSTQLDFARYLQNAFGSLQEVQYLSFELNYLNKEVFVKLDKDIGEVKAMLASLIQRIRK
jgi:four helix bundle protein